MSLTKTHSGRQLALTGLLAFALVACAVGAAPPPKSVGPTPTGSADSASLLVAIKKEIGVAACETSSQCRSIGVGTRPCGGPEGYLAWSVKTTQENRLYPLVEQHRQIRKLEHERSGVLSDCRFAPDPGAVCLPSGPDGTLTCQLAKTTTGV